MRLVRYGEAGKEKPGILDGNGRHPRSVRGDRRHRRRGAQRPTAWRSCVVLNVDSLPKVPGSPRIGAPVATPSKLIAIGLNYSDHAKEVEPCRFRAEPIVFMKATTSICGPNDAVILPQAARRRATGKSSSRSSSAARRRT